MQAKDVVLGLLMQGPKSGYDIKQEYEMGLSHFFDASYGSVYPALKQLEKSGMIVKEIVVQEGKPNKHMFTITELGERQFQHYLASPVQPDFYRSDILARLYFGKYGSADALVRWLQEGIDERIRLLRQLETAYEEHKAVLSPPRLISIQFSLQDYQAQIKVMQKGIDYLQSGQGYEFWEMSS
ncbi:PadR family transcriptional regulator [Paenibacillus apiarius]|uniref:PadR family transcriptional regulator n=1 Tax=Paenibacillus apiarius TaxID=46240 RepID=A0ABT4DNF5_9BACL|nr:PadR family transcriptional regulator [Paenibacillus apiarius]MCY9515483.1 PadR family transcriptional regulator [Paenibacillus apiarius]MCY9518892.1 PadR family transcriptional regulator [Paenibacillus apiarius]MCY9552062.1 PadR family transcriptional regulator [Paenibacillus apiarius]MCY9557262.1 PadR family transcriptional regulator [Paenibacillus apiarius]MCY9682559.1 PadR family transcriptional regulator [Paenibacillus apiarius]